MECEESERPFSNYVGAKMMIEDMVKLHYKENGEQKVENISVKSLLKIQAAMQP